MAVAELDIRNAIVALVASADGAGRVYNRFRRSPHFADFNTLNVDDGARINVVFVRRASFTEEVGSFDDAISSTENYELWFYRGVVDAQGADLAGASSESQLQLFVEAVRAILKDPANRHLLMTTPNNIVSQGGMGTVSPLATTTELGDYLCDRFVGRLSVSIEDC